MTIGAGIGVKSLGGGNSRAVRSKGTQGELNDFQDFHDTFCRVGIEAGLHRVPRARGSVHQRDQRLSRKGRGVIGILRGGDGVLENEINFKDGKVPGVILSPAEEVQLRACLNARRQK